MTNSGARSRKHSRENRTIDQLVDRLRRFNGEQVSIVSYPDRENPGIGGCDAIIVRDGSQCAVEHTSLDAFAGHRSDDPRFMRVVAPLEARIQEAYPDAYVEVWVPVRAVPAGVSWMALRERLVEGCIEALGSMQPDEVRGPLMIPAVPFPVRIRRSSQESPGCHVGRWLPGSRDDELTAIVREAIDEKSLQLAPYRAAGRRTLLVLDIETGLNEHMIARAFEVVGASSNLDGIDEIYVADTKPLDHIRFFPLKLGERRYPDLPEYLGWLRLHGRHCYGWVDV